MEVMGFAEKAGKRWNWKEVKIVDNPQAIKVKTIKRKFIEQMKTLLALTPKWLIMGKTRNRIIYTNEDFNDFRQSTKFALLGMLGGDSKDCWERIDALPMIFVED